ncbi:glyoxylase-like metal-dependent hydrolase (beta-lactamase superfamily II) [Actinophytocola oryzae]|uniref:Glyoxylase-like metal-dependent hydrolase (Beta-lactamase superfamily II) n=1 Tax=Actinophytocola oryzae TaxID=502181 RepID=A0A4R7V311_9PSEU|nr:glyoxylase-like metal-dependent hydrolase (beta-lactamase superfamily II) [Actinophytocola oryzae]
MVVHHLNCGSMKVPGGPPLVCHVLAVETGDGLVLVDTGFGTADIADPRRRVGVVRFLVHPALDPAETAVRQLTELGYERSDVRHIVITHFDLDHIGGLADFPDASVHVTAAEARGAVHSPSRQEKFRYRAVQWAHGPKLVEHSPDGEPWRGFAAASEVLPGILMLALPGHTRGHAAVAVDSGDGWILHAGDAFFHRGVIDGATPVPAVTKAHERLVAFDLPRVRDNHARLAELYRRAEPDLTITCSHDPALMPRR